MKIVFTLHANIKARERNIPKIWVIETIKYPDVTTRQKHKYIVTKKLNGLTLEVVFVIEKFIKILTLYYIK
ncbi:DUF4258 domain-containing protein [Candidatus Woesearchaeota archaeon]|nr:DUF4258 domain-containing protein [Candidatus Woesearchaeota archaeon]